MRVRSACCPRARRSRFPRSILLTLFRALLAADLHGSSMPPLGGAARAAPTEAAKPCSSPATGAGAATEAVGAAEATAVAAAVAAAAPLPTHKPGVEGATATGDLEEEWAVRPSRKAARTSNPVRNIVDHLKPNPGHGPEKPLLNMSLGGAFWACVRVVKGTGTPAPLPTHFPMPSIRSNPMIHRPHRLRQPAPAAAPPRRAGRAAPAGRLRGRPARVPMQRGQPRGAAGAGGGALVRERAADGGREFCFRLPACPLTRSALILLHSLKYTI